jgi:hypothetical protein
VETGNTVHADIVEPDRIEPLPTGDAPACTRAA